MPHPNAADKKIRPSLPRDGTRQLLTGFCILAAVAVSLQYNPLLVPWISRPRELWGGGGVLLASVTRMLLHGVQNLMLLSGWHLVARGVAHRIPKIKDSVTVLLPPTGLAACFYLLPLLDPGLSPSFPIHPAMIFLLMILFQLLTLRLEDGLDRYAALLLWVLSFQSLELLSNFPGASSALSAEITAALGMAGTALFFSFLTGAVFSTWLIARYAIRVNLLRQTWSASDLREAPGDARLKTIAMVDVNHLAHDLKNPIAAIKGTATLLRKGESLEKAALILKAAEYMENMVRELLSEDEKHALKVSELYDTIDRQIRPFPWGRDVVLTLDPEAETLSIPANKMRLLRAVFNVLDNAWRANETTGGQGVELNIRRNARRLEIEILDNGPGYNAERAQTHKSGWGSTGLGLAFTRRVIALHGGSLLIANRIDQQRGTRVLISLPIPSEATDAL